MRATWMTDAWKCSRSERRRRSRRWRSGLRMGHRRPAWRRWSVSRMSGNARTASRFSDHPGSGQVWRLSFEGGGETCFPWPSGIRPAVEMTASGCRHFGTPPRPLRSARQSMSPTGLSGQFGTGARRHALVMQPDRAVELRLIQRRRPRLRADDLVLPSGQLADALSGQLQGLVAADLHDAATHPDFLQAWRLIPAAAEHRGLGFDRIAESEWIGGWPLSDHAYRRQVGGLGRIRAGVDILPG